MAPINPTDLSHFIPLLHRRDAIHDPSTPGISPMEVQTLSRRSDTTSFMHGSGSTEASKFNNKGFLALFAILGAGMVLGSLWFFFWAKNGGFKTTSGSIKDDWEDYKSTVLRRKDENGRTLSCATKSTKLGGGSVVRGGGGTRRYGAPSSAGYTSSSGYTEKSEMREKGGGRNGRGIRGGNGDEGERRKDNNKKRKHRDPELAEYRHERPARVGGMNRAHDGQYYDYSATEPSEFSAPPPKASKKTESNNKKAIAAHRKQLERAEKKASKKRAEADKKAEKERKDKEKESKKKDRWIKRKGNKSSKNSDKSSPSKDIPGLQKPKAAVVNDGPEMRQVRGGGPGTEYTYDDDDRQTVYTGMYTNPHSDMDATSTTDFASQPAGKQAKRSTTSSGSYYDAYRPQNQTSQSRPPRSSSNSPRKPRMVQPSGGHGGQGSYAHSQVADSESGTKSYPCHIPGLSTAGSVYADESVSQIGGPGWQRRQREQRAGGGFRRGRGRRGSEMDDSEF